MSIGFTRGEVRLAKKNAVLLGTGFADVQSSFGSSKWPSAANWPP
jgi:hypothetical protein